MQFQPNRLATLLAFSPWFLGLSSSVSNALPPPLVVTYDFSQGAHGWVGDIAEYHQPLAAYQPFAGMLGVPPELGSGSAFFTRAISDSDGPFIFLKRRMTRADGLLPNYMYEVQMTIQLASKSPAGCSEPPDAPGDLVDLYVGAASEEPRPLTLNGFEYFLNVPQGTSAGDAANGLPCDQASAQSFPSVPIEREVVHASPILSEESPAFWVFLGAYLNGGGRTDLYYQQVTLTLTPVAFAPIPPLNRYLTIYPAANGGVRSAIRVELASLHHPNPPNASQSGPNFAAFEGEHRWIGPVGDCEDSPASGTTFKCEMLQCTPEYVDWEAALEPYVLYVTGSEVVPSSSFFVQTIDEGEDSNIEANYSAAVEVKTARWGDISEHTSSLRPHR